MDCVNHPGTPGTATCTECGRRFCLKCIETIAGKDVCHACVTAIQQRLMATQQAQASGVAVQAPPQAGVAPQPVPAAFRPNLGTAFLFGIVGALVGAAIWTGFTAITGWVLGYIGAAVGYVVGFAVRAGAGGPSKQGAWLGLILTFVALWLGMAGMLYFDAHLASDPKLADMPAVVKGIACIVAAPLAAAAMNPIGWLCLGLGLYGGWKTPQR